MHCLVLNNSRSVRSQQASTPQLLITPNQYYCFNTIFTRNVKKSRKVDMVFICIFCLFFLATPKKSVPSSVGSENEDVVPEMDHEGTLTQSLEPQPLKVNRRKRKKGTVSEVSASETNRQPDEAEQAEINRQREEGEQAEINRQREEAEQAEISRQREEAAEAKRLQNLTALSGAKTVRCENIVTSGEEFDRFGVGASSVASAKDDGASGQDDAAADDDDNTAANDDDDPANKVIKAEPIVEGNCFLLSTFS